MNAAHPAVIASIAKAWAAIQASFFLTSSNSLSGCLNCTRRLAWRGGAAPPAFAAPGGLAPEGGGPEAGNGRGPRRPLPPRAPALFAGPGGGGRGGRAGGG